MIENSRKKILILTAQFGAGHISAANAIKNIIQDSSDEYDVVIENFIDASVPQMNKPMVKLYESNTKYTPGLYNYYYYLKKSFTSKYDLAKKIYTPKLSEYILKSNPDLIISTFPLASACIDSFKLKYDNCKIPTLTVITDVVDSLEWVYPSTDMYFVPSREIKNRFIQKGITPDSVKVTGVPVNKLFLNEEYNKSLDKYNILIVGGGRGLFDIDIDTMYWMDDLLSSSNNNISITIITGKNEELYNDLTVNKPLKNIQVLGFVTNMHELVKDCDLMITKPGGATLFECIYSNVPVLVKVPKVGQEIENAKFIVDKGIGILYNNDNDLKNLMLSIQDNTFSSFLDFMRLNMNDFKKSLNYKNIQNYIFELINSKV